MTKYAENWTIQSKLDKAKQHFLDIEKQLCKQLAEYLTDGEITKATGAMQQICVIVRKIACEEMNERDMKIISRLSMLEEKIAHIEKIESSNYSDVIHDRHILDQLNDRLERIERLLELMSRPSIDID